jgi:Tfp pilus assembly protein PilF
MGMGLDQKALKHLKKAIRLDPGYADAHYRLGLVYVKLGDNAAARREQATLRSLDVDDLANLLGHLVDN